MSDEGFERTVDGLEAKLICWEDDNEMTVQKICKLPKDEYLAKAEEILVYLEKVLKSHAKVLKSIKVKVKSSDGGDSVGLVNKDIDMKEEV